jgi:hypothetical protein
LNLMLKPLILFKKICKFHIVDVFDIDLLSLQKFELTHMYTSKAKT